MHSQKVGFSVKFKAETERILPFSKSYKQKISGPLFIELVKNQSLAHVGAHILTL